MTDTRSADGAAVPLRGSLLGESPTLLRTFPGLLRASLRPAALAANSRLRCLGRALRASCPNPVHGHASRERAACDAITRGSVDLPATRGPPRNTYLVQRLRGHVDV